MPRKRVKKNISLDRQKNITSRLMQFSLKLDDYIYNRIPISGEKVKLYMREINSYRKYCIRDERSLQVIEKLTRCMKGIIAEQHEMQNINTDDNSPLEEQKKLDTRNNTSPVYSLPDTDKIYHTDNHINEVCDQKKSSENEIPIIDLCEDTNVDEDDEDLVEFSRPLISVDIDIQRVESQFPLQTINDIALSNTLVEKGSQSISNNNTAIINDKLVTEIRTDEHKNELVIVNSVDDNSMEIVTKYHSEVCETVTSNIGNDYKLKETNKSNLLISSTLTQTKIGQKLQKKKETKINKNDGITKMTNKQTENVENCKNTSIMKAKKKVKRPNICNDSHVDGIIPTEIDESKLKQYSEDLYWVAKITHVRNVRTSEYDSTIVISDESFWKNSKMPANWNDEEFVCVI